MKQLKFLFIITIALKFSSAFTIGDTWIYQGHRTSGSFTGVPDSNRFKINLEKLEIENGNVGNASFSIEDTLFFGDSIAITKQNEVSICNSTSWTSRQLFFCEPPTCFSVCSTTGSINSEPRKIVTYQYFTKGSECYYYDSSYGLIASKTSGYVLYSYETKLTKFNNTITNVEINQIYCSQSAIYPVIRNNIVGNPFKFADYDYYDLNGRKIKPSCLKYNNYGLKIRRNRANGNPMIIFTGINFLKQEK